MEILENANYLCIEDIHDLTQVDIPVKKIVETSIGMNKQQQ